MQKSIDKIFRTWDEFAMGRTKVIKSTFVEEN